MTGLDWVIVAFVVMLAVWGFRQGFIIGIASFAGFGLGAFLGGRLAPVVLPDGAESPYAPVAVLTGAMLIGGLAAVVLESAAFRVRPSFVRGPRTATVDGVGGASLLAAMALGFSWIAGAVLLNVPGAAELRPDLQRSRILRSLNEVLPPSGPIINALNRIDPVPDVAGPPPRVGAPDAAILGTRGVREAAASVVRVQGEACGLGVEGSGWVAGPGIVVTNAHVVAGQDDTTVQTRDGTEYSARAVHFEPRNDLAVLRAPALQAPALDLAEDAQPGASGAILGYPNNGPYAARAARLGNTELVISQDSYGRGPIRRRMTSVRGVVESGNSGGPVVGASGRVLTTVFASLTSGSRPGGFGVPNEAAGRALRGARRPVDTGPCAR